MRMYKNASLATKIRYSYMLLLIPFIVFLIFCIYNLWDVNRSYEDMINSTVVASEFSLDFKKDFDYETYLLIVENKTIAESNLDDMLNEANRIVKGLEELTESKENGERLESVKKYLTNKSTQFNSSYKIIAASNESYVEFTYNETVLRLNAKTYNFVICG